jgi:hypothetical protein
MRRSILVIVTTLVASGFVSAAEPAVPAAPVSWLCRVTDDLVRLTCITEGSLVEPAAATTAVVNGTRFPLDPRRQWEVDLWGPPTDLTHVEQLARATICYRSPGCAVQFVMPTWAHQLQPARLAANASRTRR